MFVRERARMFNAYAEGSALESVGLKAAVLSLEKPIGDTSMQTLHHSQIIPLLLYTKHQQAYIT